MAWLFNAVLNATIEPATAGKLQMPYLALKCSEEITSCVPIQIAFTPVVNPVGNALELVVLAVPSHAAAVVVTGSPFVTEYTFI